MFDEEEYGRRLLEPLAADPTDPSRVDLARAMTAGRKRRRTGRAVATTSLLAVGTAAVMAIPVVINKVSAHQAEPAASRSASAPAVPPSAEPSPAARYDRGTPPALPGSCEGELMPAGARGKVYARAIDPSGHYVAFRTYDGGTNAKIWHDGRVDSIRLPGDDNGFSAITTYGLAVGETWTKSGPVAMLYRDGKVSKLPGGAKTEPTGVNESGVIVGTTDIGGGGKPVIWRSPTGRPQDLPLPEGFSHGSAADIDEDGTVVGEVNDQGRRTAYVWSPDGRGRALPAPVVDGKPSRDFDARSISNGWVTGYADLGDRKYNSVRWDLATGTVETFPGLQWSNDINRYGWMVGMSDQNRAVLTDGRTYLVLEELFPFWKEYGMNFGTAISDDGRTVVGENDDGDRDGLQRALLWRCS